MDLTAPRTLTARAMADAAAAIDATMVFASPAALANVVSTAGAVDAAGAAALARVRILLSTGAPVPAETLHAMRRLLPAAEAHAPYGMTEVLPVADIDLAGLDDAGLGNGVCVGRPVPGVVVEIAPLGPDGVPSQERTTDPEVTGEVRRPGGPHQGALRPALGDRPGRDTEPGVAPHGRRRALRRRRAAVDRGPAGPCDRHGGRPGHAGRDRAPGGGSGGSAPGGRGRRRAARCGAGGGRGRASRGPSARPGPRIAAGCGAQRGRRAPGGPPGEGPGIAAVLQVRHLPVDIRHNSKIDRVAVGLWAQRVLDGRRPGTP